ncbi:MAG TPA: bis(5'-nucleosyl)-tetraphosphatase (symmetrical) YqeK [Dehalococcoidia bacterium]|nr:bis(5'-nucleosyl)-tetraphosphatase (symmetrical) YqeK [Dehalococcoidia bacterium]
MKNSEELLRAALTKVPAALAEHVLRVVEEAVPLADAHGVDREAAKIAALGHDLLRAHGREWLLSIARDQGHALDASERLAPVLLHGPLAVPILREQYGVLDADVLGAIAAHTTAAPGMSALQKVLFLADKIEPHKADGHAPVLQVRDLAAHDLDAALAAYLDYQVRFAVEHNWPVHPNTVAARNELLAARAERAGEN